MNCEVIRNDFNSNIIDFDFARAAYNSKNAKKNKGKTIYKKNTNSKEGKIIEFNPKVVAGGLAVAAGISGVAGMSAVNATDYAPAIVQEVGDKVTDFKEYVNNKQKDFLNRLEEFMVGDQKMYIDYETNSVYDSEEVEKMYNDLEENNRYQNLQPSGHSQYGDFQVVDLSSHNGSVDFNSLKQEGVDACIIRMFDAWNMNYAEDNLSSLDSNFVEYCEACDEADIPFGIYLYSRATTEDMARQEAYKFLKFASKYNIRPTFPVYWDIESQAREPLYTPDNQTVSSVDFINNHPDQVIRNFKAFADVLEENGYYVGIYSGDHVLSTIDPTGEELKDYSVWLARYYYGDTRCDFENNTIIQDPTYKGNISMYQFSSTGRFNGTNSNVDCSYCIHNYAKPIEKYELNRPLNYDATDFDYEDRKLGYNDSKIISLGNYTNNEKVLKLVA